MATPARIQVNGTSTYLDGVTVDQGLGGATREGVTIGDPTTGSSLAAVLSTTPSNTELGLVVRAITQGTPMTMTVGGVNRVASTTTLFDGKHLNADDAYKWDIAGTGSSAFSNNALTMSVTAGQYLVRQAQHWNPYFSGKPQLIESTYFNFKLQAGVLKRVGYFSSSATAPYTANLDGLFLESDGITDNTYKLVTYNNGTVTHSIPWTDWDNYAAIQAYDWERFSVSEFDFLWLGGAGLRLFQIINGTFTLLHTIADHAGYADNLIILSPNQPVRYEIRSSTGSGSFVEVCSQVASEGSNSEEGEELTVFNETAIACNSVGTIYALLGVEKTAANRNIHVDIQSFGGSIAGATSDSGILLLLLDPTITGTALTAAGNSRINELIGSSTSIVTAGTGRVLGALPLNTGASVSAAPQGGLRSLPIDIDNVAGRVVLCYMPTTVNQKLIGQITVVEY